MFTEFACQCTYRDVYGPALPVILVGVGVQAHIQPVVTWITIPKCLRNSPVNACIGILGSTRTAFVAKGFVLQCTYSLAYGSVPSIPTPTHSTISSDGYSSTVFKDQPGEYPSGVPLSLCRTCDLLQRRDSSNLGFILELRPVRASNTRAPSIVGIQLGTWDGPEECSDESRVQPCGYLVMTCTWRPSTIEDVHPPLLVSPVVQNSPLLLVTQFKDPHRRYLPRNSDPSRSSSSRPPNGPTCPETSPGGLLALGYEHRFPYRTRRQICNLSGRACK